MFGLYQGISVPSGGGQIGVHVFVRVLDNEVQNELPLPHRTLSDHTLPITDIQCGVGALLTCRILTASVDHSVKVRDPLYKDEISANS